jgi:hypothetical protein
LAGSALVSTSLNRMPSINAGRKSVQALKPVNAMAVGLGLAVLVSGVKLSHSTFEVVAVDRFGKLRSGRV